MNTFSNANSILFGIKDPESEKTFVSQDINLEIQNESPKRIFPKAFLNVRNSFTDPVSVLI